MSRVETDPVKIAAARKRLAEEAPALSKAAWDFVRNGRRQKEPNV